MGVRKAVTNKMAAAYRRGSRLEKTAILDQLCELAGWHRDHARARLRDAGEIRVVHARAARRPVYSPRVVPGLELCWRVARLPAGKRLAPMLPVLVRLLRRDGELTDDEAGLLYAMSAATIDSRLKVLSSLPSSEGAPILSPGACSSLRYRSEPGRSGTRGLPALSRSTSPATRAGTPSGSSASPLR